MIDSVVDLVEENVHLGASQFSESTVERWYSAHASQQNVVNLTSEVHVCLVHHHWFMILVMISNGLFHSWSTLNVSLSWAERTRELSCASAIWRVATSRSILSWVCSTLTLLLSSDERIWISSVSTGRSVLSEELSSSQIELTLIPRERNVFLPSCMLSSPPDLSRIGFGVGWVGWKILLVEQLLLLVAEKLSNPILVHSCFSEILGGGRSDMYTLSCKTSPISIPTTLEYNKLDVFLEEWLHSIESEKMSILTASWCLFHALCTYCARRGTFKSISWGSLWLLSLGSTGRKNTVCLLLEFWPPGIDPELMKEWRLNAHPIW